MTEPWGRKAVADALHKTGAKVEVHDDHFPVGALDVEWLPIVGERGWLILTKDGAIGRRLLEQMAVASMEGFAQGNSQPFIAKV